MSNTVRGSSSSRKSSKKTKWLFYVALVGIIPFVVRLLIYLFYKSISWEFLLNESDLVTFGLALNLNNINELGDKNGIDKDWKITRIAASVLFIVLFAVMYGLILKSDLTKDTDYDSLITKLSCLFFVCGTLFFSYAIFKKLK